VQLNSQSNLLSDQAQSLKLEIAQTSDLVRAAAAGRVEQTKAVEHYIESQLQQRKTDTAEMQHELKRLGEGVRQSEFSRRAEAERLAALHTQVEDRRNEDMIMFTKSMKALEDGRAADLQTVAGALQRHEEARKSEMLELGTLVGTAMSNAMQTEQRRQEANAEINRAIEETKVRRDADTRRVAEMLKEMQREREKIERKKILDIEVLKVDIGKNAELIEASEEARKADVVR
jgi:hypothetical protein